MPRNIPARRKAPGRSFRGSATGRPSLFPAPTGFLHFLRLAPVCHRKEKECLGLNPRSRTRPCPPSFHRGLSGLGEGAQTPIHIPDLPKIRNSRHRRLSFKEAEAIVRSTGSSVHENLLRVALETATRRSEITKMRWGAVDLSIRTVTLVDTKN